jgi:hypothetical protein
MARHCGHRALVAAGVLLALAVLAMLTAGCSSPAASAAGPASVTSPTPQASPATAYWSTGNRLVCEKAEREAVTAITATVSRSRLR